MAIRVTRLFGVPIVVVKVPETPALKERFLPEMLRRYQEKLYNKPAPWETDRVHTSYEAERREALEAV